MARKRVRPRVKAAGAFHHGDLREAMIVAGLQAVESAGHAKLSLRPLAERLGVTQPAVYRHFRDKQALLAAVAERGWLGLDAAMATAMDATRQAGADAFEVMRRGSRAYVDWGQAHPNLFRLFSSRIPAEQRGAAAPPLPRAHYVRGMAGIIPIDEPRLPDAFRVTWAMVHGLTTMVVEHVFQLVDTDEARLRVAYDAIDTYVDMLRATWPA